MWDFLDQAQDLWARGEIRPEDREHFERVFDVVGALQIANSKARVDLVNIESVFNTLEMAKLVQAFPRTERQTTPEQAIQSLRVVIAATLEETTKFPYARGRGLAAPEPYPAFAELVRHLQRTAHPPHSVAVLTFNYDVCLDLALALAGVGYDYCLDPQTRPGVGVVPLLKLHGSLNWAIRDTQALEVVPWRMENFVQLLNAALFDDGLRYVLRPREHFRAFSDRVLGGAGLKDSPFIVPPTWNKSDHHMAIQPVWKRAAEELSGAANIFVVGYSLPETDGFFKGLYALGTIGPQPLRRFWVVDPSDTVSTRFKSLLGAGADGRFQHLQMAFTQGIAHMRQPFPERAF
jgi:hypothetical protein